MSVQHAKSAAGMSPIVAEVQLLHSKEVASAPSSNARDVTAVSNQN
jgi:hypothetical protein